MVSLFSTDRLSEGMNFLRTVIPDGLESRVEYFDSYYVSGIYRATRGPAVFWNPHEMGHQCIIPKCGMCMMLRFMTVHAQIMYVKVGITHLVGHKNPSLWQTIRCFQKSQLNALTEMDRLRIWEPVRKRVHKKTVQHQQKLKACVQILLVVWTVVLNSWDV